MSKSNLAAIATEHSHSLTSKFIVVTGGASAAAHTPIGGWFTDAGDWLSNWPSVETLSYIAIALLVLERSFLLFARITEFIQKYKNKKTKSED